MWRRRFPGEPIEIKLEYLVKSSRGFQMEYINFFMSFITAILHHSRANVVSSLSAGHLYVIRANFTKERLIYLRRARAARSDFAAVYIEGNLINRIAALRFARFIPCLFPSDRPRAAIKRNEST